MSLEVSLPRGCELIQHSKAEVVRRFLLHDWHIEYDAAGWERKWGARERVAMSVYQQAVRYFLSSGHENEPVNEFLGQIDEETQLRNGILLAQGLSNSEKNKFVVIHSNRLGITNSSRNSLFAIGGRITFELESHSLTFTRRMSGKCIGVMLNSSSRLASLREGETGHLSSESIDSLLVSVVEAQKELYQAEKRGSLNEFFTQEEFETAYNWMLFRRSL